MLCCIFHLFVLIFVCGKKTWKYHSSFCIHSASSKCQELLGNRHRGESPCQNSGKTKMETLTYLFTIKTLIYWVWIKAEKSETQSSSKPLKQCQPERCRDCSKSKWKMNEGDQAKFSGRMHFGFLVEAVSDLPCMYLSEHLESFEFINHFKFWECFTWKTIK